MASIFCLGLLVLSTEACESEGMLRAYDGLGATVLRRFTVETQASQPAVLIGQTPAQVSGNNLLSPGSGAAATNYATAQQRIVQPGDWVEATMVTDVASSGTAHFGVSVLANPINVPGNERDFSVLFLTIDGTSTIAIDENGVFKTSVSGTSNSERIRIQFNGQNVLFYRNYTGPDTVPFYVSETDPRLPYKLSLVTQHDTHIDNVIISSTSAPSVARYVSRRLPLMLR
jgi:hypothetical protein